MNVYPFSIFKRVDRPCFLVSFKDDDGKYLPSGWRHFFTAYMIRRLDKKLLKSQTGHKTDVMLAYYGDHETEGDRELIQAQEREAFAGLLPERSTMLMFRKQQSA